jgi:hypothetical protein
MLEEKHIQSVFEDRELRRIFGPKRDEATGGCKTMHNVELHSTCSSPDIIGVIKSRTTKWAGHVARMGAMKSSYRILVEKPKRKSLLGRNRRTWEESINRDFRKSSVWGVDWNNLAQYRD